MIKLSKKSRKLLVQAHDLIGDGEEKIFDAMDKFVAFLRQVKKENAKPQKKVRG